MVTFTQLPHQQIDFMLSCSHQKHIHFKKTSIDRQIITTQYLCSMQEIINWFWDQHTQQQVITVPTCKILHLQLDSTVIAYINDIHKNVCNITQAKKTYQDILFVLLDMTTIES